MNSNQTEANKFCTYHSNPNALSISDLPLMKEWIEKYPYCQSLHYLASRTAINTQEYQNFLTKAAAIAPSRAVLHAVIYEPEQFFTTLNNIEEEENQDKTTLQINQDNSDNPFGIDLNQIYGSEFKVETTELGVEAFTEALEPENQETLLVEDDVEVEIWNLEEEQVIAEGLNLDSEVVSENLGKQTKLEIVDEEEEFEIALKGEEQIALFQETEIVENIGSKITEEVELVVEEEIVENQEIKSVENVEEEAEVIEEFEPVVEEQEIVEDTETAIVDNVEEVAEIIEEFDQVVGEEIVENQEIELVENVEEEAEVIEEFEPVVEEQEIVEDTEIEVAEDFDLVIEEEIVENQEIESVENIEEEAEVTEAFESVVEEQKTEEDTEIEVAGDFDLVIEEEEVVIDKEKEQFEKELVVSFSTTEPIEKDELQLDHPVQADFFALNRKELAKIEVKEEEQSISQYNDERMPYTFLWWLNKTRKEHSSNHQPYSSFKLDTSKQIKKADPDKLNQQIAENIFHLRGVEDISSSSSNYTVPFDFRKKEFQIIEKFIKEEPQIKPPTANKIDSENKAKRSSEDANQVVSETLAKIYVEQMLYHKALDVYKKLSLKFPEKSTYFASQIKYLELKVN